MILLFVDAALPSPGPRLDLQTVVLQTASQSGDCHRSTLCTSQANTSVQMCDSNTQGRNQLIFSEGQNESHFMLHYFRGGGTMVVPSTLYVITKHDFENFGGGKLPSCPPP